MVSRTGGREHIALGKELHKLNGFTLAGDEASNTRDGFGEGAADHITSTKHVVVFLQTATSFAETADSMSLVTDQQHGVLIAQAAGFREVAQIPVHRVDTLNHQELLGVFGDFLYFSFEILVVIMFEVNDLRATQFESGSEGGMAILVGEDHVARASQSLRDTHAG